MTDEATRTLMANADAMRRGALPMWAICDKPADWPDGLIARMHEAPGGPTQATLKGELGRLREVFWKAGLMRLSRQGGDEPQIVGTWV